MAHVVYSGSRTLPHSMLSRSACPSSLIPRPGCNRFQHTRAISSPQGNIAQVAAVDGVNESQRQAVQHDLGCCRVIAGPGSGKTRVLVKRLEHLLRSGVDPRAILAITFTRKASWEMRERLHKLVDKDQVKYLTIGTYHAVCGSALRRWIHALPGSSQYTAAFTTASDQDVKRIIARHLRPLFCDPEQGFKQLRHNLDPSFLQILKFAEQRLLRDRKSSTRLSSQVDMLAQDCHSTLLKLIRRGKPIWPGLQPQLKTTKAYFESIASETVSELFPSVGRTRSETAQPTPWQILYTKVWPQAIAQTFDELQESNTVWLDMYVPLVNILFQRSKAFNSRMAKYKHELVDEVQDNDRSQYDFVSALHRTANGSVFLVGDLDQAIYQFRGADASLFRTECEKTFPAMASYNIPENYRSVPSIIRAAEAVANCASGRKRTEPAVMRSVDLPVMFTVTPNEAVEASRMAEAIQHFRAAGVRGQDIAVLYPKHVYGERVEQALLVQRIPYRRYGNVTIMDSKVGRDLLAYLCLAANPMHTLALSRIKNVPPRGLGEKSWNNLTQQVEGSSRGISLNRFLFEDICDAWASEDAVQQCVDAWCGSNESTGDPLKRLQATMQSLSDAGALAPAMHWDPSVIKKKPGVKQRNAIQRLRDLLVCVRSEAARHGPERAMVVLQVLSGYSYHLNKGGDEDEQQKAVLFVSIMKNSVLDPASGALGEPSIASSSVPAARAVHPAMHPAVAVGQGFTGDSRASVMPSPPPSMSTMAPPSPLKPRSDAVSAQFSAATTSGDAPLMDNPEQYMPPHPDSADTPDDSFEFLRWLLTSGVPEMLDYDQLKSPSMHAGMHLMHACAENMLFVESTTLALFSDQPPSGAPNSTTMSVSEEDKVQLMTIHKSKGLEFTVVFVLGLSEAGTTMVPPSGPAADDFSLQEAAKNLVYVGVTRAKDALVVSSHCNISTHAPHGMRTERHYGNPSIFLQAMYKEFEVDLHSAEELMHADSMVNIEDPTPFHRKIGYPKNQGWDDVPEVVSRLKRIRESGL